MQAFLLPSAVENVLDMIVGKIENGLQPGFVKYCLNCLLITDPKAQFRRRTFHESNLIQIKVGPNHENPAF